MSRGVRGVRSSAGRRMAVGLAIFLLMLGARLGGQELRFVMTIQDDTCPLQLTDLRTEPRLRGLDLVIAGTIANPTRRNVQSLVVTAALIDAADRVVGLQTQPLPVAIGPGGKRPFRIVFDEFAPTPGEHVAFGIQAIRWSKTEEWRGVLKLVTAPAALASNGVVR